MKNGELKNRLRRRTADKLYDRARSTGRMPNQLPAGEPAAIADRGGTRSVSRRGKQSASENLAR